MPTSDPSRRLPGSPQVRDLFAVCYPEYMDYAAYSAGMDLSDPECVLELTFELHRYFDNEFPAPVLSACLAELKPRVLLLPIPEEGRVDWPWVEEENLARIYEWCYQQQYGSLSPYQQILGLFTADQNPSQAQEPETPYGVNFVQAVEAIQQESLSTGTHATNQAA